MHNQYVKMGLSAFAAIFYSCMVLANPSGGSVAAGQAHITQPSGIYTQINQTSDKAVINWQRFTIGAGEHTHFNQPSRTAMTLNRVTGGDASHIFGRLTANGRLLLINPRGIWFGPGSVVNAASFIASTHHITNENFMAGHLTFEPIAEHQTPYGLINEGNITVEDRGLVALMAPGVENHGVIKANLGYVTLAAGNAFTFDLFGDELINFSIDKPTTKPILAPDGSGRVFENGIKNTGYIKARDGKMLISANMAANVVENSVNLDGILEANRVVQSDGKIHILSHGSGKVDVKGRIQANKGEVWILGKKVKITGRARIEAIEGEILIGGDYKGQNNRVPITAEQTQVYQDTVLNAQGGNTIVWSDGITYFDGIAYGQLVETSGHYLYLGHNKKIITNVGGTWLIDPFDIEIGAFATSDNSGPPNFTPSGQPSRINIADINNQLSAGTSVFLDTSGAGGGTGNITFFSPVVSAGNGSLVLIPTNNAILGQNMTLNNGSLTVNGNTVIDGTSAWTISGLNIMFNGDLSSINFTGATQNLTATTINLNGNATLSANLNFNSHVVNIGNVTTNTFSNTQVTRFSNASGTTTFNAGSVSSGVVFFDADTALEINGNTSINGRIVLNGGLTVNGNNNNLVINHGNSWVEPSGTLVTFNNIAGTTTINNNGIINLGNTDFVFNGNTVLTNNAFIFEDLTVNGTSNLGADVTSTGTQNYVGAVTQTIDAIINAASFAYNNWNASGFNLTLHTPADFNANLSNVNNISFNSTATITGTPSATGSVTFAGVTTLAGGTTITAPHVQFNNTLNAANFDLNIVGNLSLGNGVAIAINNPDGIIVSGNVTANILSNSLTVVDDFDVGEILTLNNHLSINGPSIDINGLVGNGFDFAATNNVNLGGIYSGIDDFTLPANTTLVNNTTITANTVTIPSLSGNGFALTLSSGANTLTGTSYTNFSTFTATGPTALTNPTVFNTTSGITFNGDVTGGQAVSLATGGDINFNGTGTNLFGTMTVNTANHVNVNNGGTLSVAGFVQSAGTGSSHFGPASLNAGGGDVSVLTAGDITGHIVGNNIILGSGGGFIAVDVTAVTSLSVFSLNGATITGIVNGIIVPASDPFFSQFITIDTGALGTFTFNGFTINGGPLIASEQANPYQDDEQTDTQTQIDDGCNSLSDDEYQAAHEDVFGEAEYSCS